MLAGGCCSSGAGVVFVLLFGVASVLRWCDQCVSVLVLGGGAGNVAGVLLVALLLVCGVVVGLWCWAGAGAAVSGVVAVVDGLCGAGAGAGAKAIPHHRPQTHLLCKHMCI